MKTPGPFEEVSVLDWKEGPTERGCVYHKRAICPLGDDSLVVDVFIMPSIVRYRPIAITLGRYRNYEAIQKEKWQLSDIEDLSPIPQAVPVLLKNLGVSTTEASNISNDIEQLLRREAANIKNVLAAI